MAHRQKGTLKSFVVCLIFKQKGSFLEMRKLRPKEGRASSNWLQLLETETVDSVQVLLGPI